MNVKTIVQIISLVAAVASIAEHANATLAPHVRDTGLGDFAKRLAGRAGHQVRSAVRSTSRATSSVRHASTPSSRAFQKA